MPHATAADGTSLHYRDWGSGAPAVLIGGWPLNGDMWEYQAMALVQRGHRVIAYDSRGFGHSGHPWEGYDYNTFADDLRAVMQAAKVENAALVGNRWRAP